MDVSRRQAVRDATLYIGARIRAGRVLAGVSQEALGAALGISFQQVQKYERGGNRVSACALVAIAAELKLPVGYFLPPDPAAAAPVGAAELAAVRAAIAATFAELDNAVDRLDSAGTRLRGVVGDLLAPAAAESAR